MFPEAASLGQLPSDASLEDRYEWDAWADVHPDATADGFHPDLLDVDAGKSADLELDDRAQDGWQSDDSRLAVPAESAVLYTPGEGQSAARSCAVPEFAVARVLQVAL